MAQENTRVFARRVAVQLMTAEEVDQVAGGGFSLPATVTDSYCLVGDPAWGWGESHAADDCAGD
jgi:hypothetical protein